MDDKPSRGKEIEWLQQDRQRGLEIGGSVRKPVARRAIYYAMIAVSLIFGETQQQFIYFQFLPAGRIYVSARRLDYWGPRMSQTGHEGLRSDGSDRKGRLIEFPESGEGIAFHDTFNRIEAGQRRFQYGAED